MQTSPVNASVAEFTIGSVLGRTFSTIMKNPVVFFGLTLGALLPSTLCGILFPVSPDNYLAPFLTAMILQWIFLLLSQAAVSYAVFQALRNNSASFGAAASRGFARALPLMVAAVLMAFAIWLGFVLLIFPALMLACMWAVTIPACVVERMGAVESMKRSAELTRGYRWKVLALIIITAVVTNVIAYLVTFIVAGLTGSIIVTAILVMLATTVPQAVTSAMSATMYYEFRRIKEGVSLDSLANVFD